MSSSQIAVIGAAMAGIIAARKLSAAGFNPQLFEKSRGSGGRLASKHSEMGRVNLGAQAFSADDPQFIQELHNWQQAGWVECLESDTRQWTGTPYMSALTRHLLGTIKTHFACEITSLDYVTDGWLLYDQHQQVHGPFQQLIVAIPAPQAQALLSHCAPKFAAHADAVVMQPVWMVALGFKQPISTPNNLKRLNNSTIAEVIHTPLSAQHPMQSLMLRASHSWSTEHLEDQHEQVIAALTDALAEQLDSPMPVADSAFAHRWRYALGALEKPLTLLADAQRGLYIAGDWCGYGDVQSAWHSGQQAAQQVIDNQDTVFKPKQPC